MCMSNDSNLNVFVLSHLLMFFVDLSNDNRSSSCITMSIELMITTGEAHLHELVAMLKYFILFSAKMSFFLLVIFSLFLKISLLYFCLL